jgi:hypothetical protein
MLARSSAMPVIRVAKLPDLRYLQAIKKVNLYHPR